MAIVVTNIGTAANTSGATVAITVPGGGVPAGALIFLGGLEFTNTSTLGAIADTAANTYTNISSAHPNAQNNQGLAQTFYAKNCSALASGNAITFTKVSSGARAAITAFYATGIDTVAPLDTAATASATGQSNAPSVTAGTPGTANDLLVGFVALHANLSAFTQDSTNGAWASPPATANSGTSGTDAYVNGASLVVSGTPAQMYAPTTTGGQQWAALICAFKPTRNVNGIGAGTAAAPYGSGSGTLDESGGGAGQAVAPNASGAGTVLGDFGIGTAPSAKASGAGAVQPVGPGAGKAASPNVRASGRLDESGSGSGTAVAPKATGGGALNESGSGAAKAASPGANGSGHLDESGGGAGFAPAPSVSVETLLFGMWQDAIATNVIWTLQTSAPAIWSQQTSCTDANWIET